MTQRTLSIAIAIALVLGVLTAAAVVVQNQQITILADSVERLSDQVDDVFDLVEEKATVEKEDLVEVEDITGRQEGVRFDSFVDGIRTILKERGSDPINPERVCYDYSVVEVVNGNEIVLVTSLIDTMQWENFTTEGGGCVFFQIGIADVGESEWLSIRLKGDYTGSPYFLVKRKTGEIQKLETRLSGGTRNLSGRYYVGVLQEVPKEVIAVLDLLTDEVVATQEIPIGRSIVVEAGILSEFSPMYWMADGSVQYRTYDVTEAFPRLNATTETWEVPGL